MRKPRHRDTVITLVHPNGDTLSYPMHVLTADQRKMIRETGTLTLKYNTYKIKEYTS